MNSSDLSLDFDHRTDVDYVIALGIAEARNSQVAAPLMRLHTTTSRLALKDAYRAVEALVRRLDSKLNWRLSGQAIRTVAERALAHHIAPVCPHCKGRGFELQENSPVLSAKACKHCHGDGRRPVQRKYRDEITKLIAALEAIDSATERAVARLVR
jgi:hypothetical protein